VTLVRPIYETNDDLYRESSFIERLCTLWGFDSRKLPIKYKIDYALLRDRVIRAFLEVKIRKYTKDYFYAYMISMDKVETAQKHSRFAGVPTILAVKWQDDAGYVVLDTLKNFTIGFGGRADRDDKQDMEPIVYIPISQFKAIE
tara:strand:- start:8 stop:439 length:432 start_codon:yes stop_codon:yes gene_type:complete